MDKLQERLKDLLKEVEKLRQESDKLKIKNESLTQLNNELGPLKKQVNLLRSENSQLQKSSSTSSQQLIQSEKTKDFYKNAYEEADQIVKKLQEEKERGVMEKMESITSENAKLREELNRFRESYDRKILQLANAAGPSNIEVSTPIM